MSERDILITRLVDREDTPVDWARFEELAGEDRELKGQLLSAFADESTLRAAMGNVIAMADRVELQPDPAAPRKSVPSRLGKGGNLIPWGGWMAAAVLALIWMATDPRMKRAPESTQPRVAKNQSSGLAPRAPGATTIEPEAPSTATSAQLAGGQIVRELPNTLVETRNIPGSDKIEVMYLRRILQRAIVSDAFTLGRDETGQPVQVRFDAAKYASPRSY